MCEIDDDFERADVWRETPRTARKQHRCSCCGGAIEPGQQYIDHFDVFEGEISRSKLCRSCEVDRAAFAAAHGNFMPNPLGFSDMLSDCIADGDEESEKQWQPMLDRINRTYRESKA